MFFQPRQRKGTKERSAQNSRKGRTIYHTPRITVINHTSPNPHSFIPNKPFQTHLNYSSNLNRQQPRNNYHPDDATPLKNQQYRAITNPYLANIGPQRHDISSNKFPPNLILSPKTMPQSSKITSIKPIKMRIYQKIAQSTNTPKADIVFESVIHLLIFNRLQ